MRRGFGMRATRDLCIVTRDRNITRRPHERIALHDAELGAFFLSGKRSPRVCQIVQTMIRPELKRLAGSEPRPFQFEIGERRVSRLR